MSQTIEQFEDLLKNCSDSYKGEVPTVSDEEYQTLYDSNLVSYLYPGAIVNAIVIL